MKLWVDDIRNAPDESWTVARTVTSAIRALSMFNPDEISLDHDISHQVTVGRLGRPYPCEETFMAVAFYLTEKYSYRTEGQWQPKITIHSSNVVAGEEMQALLAEHGLDSDHRPVHLANRLEMET